MVTEKQAWPCSGIALIPCCEPVRRRRTPWNPIESINGKACLSPAFSLYPFLPLLFSCLWKNPSFCEKTCKFPVPFLKEPPLKLLYMWCYISWQTDPDTDPDFWTQIWLGTKQVLYPSLLTSLLLGFFSFYQTKQGVNNGVVPHHIGPGF